MRSQPKTLLNPAVGRRDLSPAGGVRLVAFGDSTIAANTITNGAGNNFGMEWGNRDFVGWGHVLSGGKFLYVRNSGIAGNYTTDLLSRFDRDVVPYRPDIVFLVVGINDAVVALRSLEEYQRNVIALVHRIRHIGAVPWIGTVSANVNTGAKLQKIAQYNTWLKQFCAEQGIPVVDINAVMSNPADGTILSAYNLDGTHQNEAGGYAIGQALAAVVNKQLGHWAPDLPTCNTADSKNLLSNALFLTGSTLATGWSGAGGTASLITGDTAIKGNWQRLTDDGAAGTQYFQQTGVAVPSGSRPGDVIQFCGRIRQVNGTGAGSVQVLIRFVGSSDVGYVLRNASVDFDGVFTRDFYLPAGVTSFTAQMMRTVTSHGTGYIQAAQWSIRNKSLDATTH